MKTSNILFLTAVLLFLSGMIVYNFQLKAEYLTMKKQGFGEYKNERRFSNYEKLEISNFQEIDLRSANLVRTTIEYGPEEAVWLDKGGKEMVKVSQNGKTLIVDLSDKGKHDEQDSYKGAVIITSPGVKSIRTAPFLPKLPKDAEKRKTSYSTFFVDKIYINGFQQDSLLLNIMGLTNVGLDKNKIKYLDSRVGNPNLAAELYIDSNNEIDAVKLQVSGKSKVELLDSDLKSIEQHVSEEAIVTLRGRALHQLNGK